MRLADKYQNAHAHPAGPGDDRPTALQVIHDEDLQGRLQDCVALVTGGAGSLGTEMAKALHAAGCQVSLQLLVTQARTDKLSCCKQCMQLQNPVQMPFRLCCRSGVKRRETLLSDRLRKPTAELMALQCQLAQ